MPDPMIHTIAQIIEKLELAHLHREVLEPDPKTRSLLTQAVGQYAAEFIDAIDTHKSFDARWDTLNYDFFKLDTKPISLTEFLIHFQSDVQRPGLNPASGGHLGYIPGGGIYVSALGDFLAAVSNEYAGLFYAGPGAVRIENSCIRFLCNTFHYPESAHGCLLSGGSLSNLTAMTTARIARNIRARDMESQVVYMTEQVHHSVPKSLRLAGMEDMQVRIIPIDAQYRMDMEALEATIKKDIQDQFTPAILIASAGTTDTGVVDPLNAIAELAKKYHCWFHVDAAYGGMFILSALTRNLFEGIAEADSIVVDPHKGLFLPYGLGAVLVKNGMHLHQANRYKASYMTDAQDHTEEWSPAELGPELTKHFRSLRMFLPLKLLGIKPFIACLEEKIWLCRYFYEKIEALGFERGPYPELSVMIYRAIPPSGDINLYNKQLVELLHQDGRVFISSTVLQGQVWLRLALLSFRTSRYHIDTLLDMIQKALKQMK